MTITDGIKIIKSHIKNMPGKPGVYRMLDEDKNPIYIGKAKNLPKRVTSYTKPEFLPYRLQKMISLTRSMEVTIAKSEAEALLLEANLIRKLQPKFNIMLKDDKSFPYILLTGDSEYNMLKKYRGKKESKKGQYFGPFPSAGAVNRTINTLQKAFPLRSCSDSVFDSRTRPCLEYQIKRCTAPCVDKIEKPEYDQIVEDARDFLQGKTSQVQSKLAGKMQEASDQMEFEKAANYRDRIAALTKVQNQNKISLQTSGDADVIAIYREGNQASVQIYFIRGGQNYGNRAYFPTNTTDISDEEVLGSFIGQFYQKNYPPKNLLVNIKLKEADLLEEALGMKTNYKIKILTPQKGEKASFLKTVELNAKEALARKNAENAAHSKLLKLFAEQFELSEAPERIEVYDNSHIQGTNAIGAMIVVTEDGFDKKSYRKYIMKSSNASDDYDMMREMLTRRFTKAQKENSIIPDVCLIDGGAGHLSTAVQVLEDLGVSNVLLIAIAKGPERNAGKEEYHMLGKKPFSLERKSQLAYFMQRIRDEAHRFAITSHRARRSKDIKRSELDEIAGIGATRKKALLHHFGSVASIKQASKSELNKVEGINAKTAEAIYNFFH